MIISSSRLRRVDTPDAETPGAVPPPPKAPKTPKATPATAPAASPAATTTPTPAAPAAARSKGLVIGLIAGGAVLVIVAIIAVVALVLPALFGGSATKQALVTDINGEPDTTWKYDFLGKSDSTYLADAPRTVAVGEDKALVWAEFDYSAYSADQGDSAGWYKGYDEQYSDGYAAGLLYLDAVNAWYEDYNADYPEEESYFPDGTYDDYDKYLGVQDGFYDAAYELGEGSSQKIKPTDPGYTPTIALIDVNSGDEVWSVDLSDAIDGVDFNSQFSAYDIEGTNAIAVVTSVSDDDSTSYAVVTLDKSNGEVISELDSDGPASATPVGGDLVVATSDSDGTHAKVARYSVAGLDDDPKWESKQDGSPFIYVDGDYIYVFDSEDDEGVMLNSSDGEEADFGDDIDSSTTYSFVGSQLIRSEYGDDSTEIEGYGLNGKSTWDDSVEADHIALESDSIFTMKAKGDAYTKLMRINPSNGEEIWGDSYDESFDGVLGVVGNSVLLSDGTKIVVVDLGSGEEKFSQKVGTVDSYYFGGNQYYVQSGDELDAYSYGEKGDVWGFDLDDNETIVQLGSHLAVLNYDKGTLHGLAAK